MALVGWSVGRMVALPSSPLPCFELTDVGNGGKQGTMEGLAMNVSEKTGNSSPTEIPHHLQNWFPGQPLPFIVNAVLLSLSMCAEYAPLGYNILVGSGKP